MENSEEKFNLIKSLINSFKAFISDTAETIRGIPEINELPNKEFENGKVTENEKAELMKTYSKCFVQRPKLSRQNGRNNKWVTTAEEHEKVIQVEETAEPSKIEELEQERENM